eukprot:jgi/Orpsp1_1/1192772/evm.model.d7180000095766.1
MKLFATQIIYLLYIVFAFTNSIPNNVYKRDEYEYDIKSKFLRSMEIFKGIKPECFAALNQLMLNNGCKITEYTKRQKSDIYPEKKQDFCTAMQSDV